MQFNPEQWIRQILIDSDIPERYLDLMLTIILYMAEHPESTLIDACRIYAEQHQRSELTVYRTFRRAILSGWENAVTPSSMLYTHRMSPEEFVQKIISRLDI